MVVPIWERFYIIHVILTISLHCTEEGEEGRNAQLGSASKPKAPAAGGASATAESEDTRPRNKVRASRYCMQL